MIDFYRDWRRSEPEELLALDELTTEEFQCRDISICPSWEDFGPVDEQVRGLSEAEEVASFRVPARRGPGPATAGVAAGVAPCHRHKRRRHASGPARTAGSCSGRSGSAPGFGAAIPPTSGTASSS